ncbi:MAG TPA: M50 family metallopeptidase [Nitrososphaerales archaeon]|nr:M50 family metallopeptidase [Nitrososphaerales archaeon]
MATGSSDVSAIYELVYNPGYRPKTSRNGHIENLTVDGKPSHILMKEPQAEYYEVDEQTNTIWSLMDGKKTIQNIYEEARKTDSKLTEDQVRDTIVSLAEEGVIEGTEPEFKHRRIELVSAFQLDVHLLNDSSETLAGLFRFTRRLIRKEELPVAIGVAALGFALFFGSFLGLFEHPSLFNVAGSAVLGIFFYQLLVLLPVYAVHELAHAAVCDYYGGKPREIGTGLYYLAPFFYCDTSDSWRLSRRARIMISVAGPLSTVVIASILVFCSYSVGPGTLQNVLKIAAFFGFYGTLTNFSPVIETDGYYILADTLGIPNLRDEVFGYVKRGVLKALGRPVASVRHSAKHRRIVAAYTVATIAWLAFFGYTTLWLLGVYGTDAYASLLGLGRTLLSIQAFDLTSVGVNIATIAYFALTLAGFAVMGTVAYRRVRMKGVKLETIHDKRVSAFLPLPSSMRRADGSELVSKAKRLASNFSKSYSVTLEPPLCVTALKLGKVDQSLDAMRGEMQKIESSFRAMHREFLSRHRGLEVNSKEREMADNLSSLVDHFPPLERKRAALSVSHFLKRQDEMVESLLQSAFGTVWTLELSPSDYGRIRRQIFPSLIADDLAATDLPGEVEEFKKTTVVGYDAIAKLSSEIEEESREVYKRPEVYQITAFLEPMKSRLVFVGRTDKVEGSVVWLGGLYLYQAWIGYISEILDEAALGLVSLRLAHSSFTKNHAAKLSGDEVTELEQDFGRVEKLVKTVEDAMVRVESTFESAMNFHETLDMLVSDEIFDIGLYKPILSANGAHLHGVKEEIEEFRVEFGKISKRLATSAEIIRGEASRRAKESPQRAGWSGRLFSISPLFSRGNRNRSASYDAQVKLMFATSRLVYGVVVGSDVIL